MIKESRLSRHSLLTQPLVTDAPMCDRDQELVQHVRCSLCFLLFCVFLFDLLVCVCFLGYFIFALKLYIFLKCKIYESKEKHLLTSGNSGEIWLNQCVAL